LRFRGITFIVGFLFGNLFCLLYFIPFQTVEDEPRNGILFFFLFHSFLISSFIFFNLIHCLFILLEVNTLERRTSLEISSPSYPVWNDLTSLVVCAAHGLYFGNNFWYLEPPQEKQISSFVAHVNIAIQIADEDQKSLLLFSGGQTRFKAGPVAEANGYWEVANERNWFGHPSLFFLFFSFLFFSFLFFLFLSFFFLDLKYIEIESIIKRCSISCINRRVCKRFFWKSFI